MNFFDELLCPSVERLPDKLALIHEQQSLNYKELNASISLWAQKLIGLGVKRSDRVAVFLPKTPANVIALFATSRANAVFVPINVVLKPAQVQHILADCGVKVLVTCSARLNSLKPILQQLPSLQHVVLTDKPENEKNDNQAANSARVLVHCIDNLTSCQTSKYQRVENDLAAILYTSGSTGKPKGVMLSHRNLVCGAQSVAMYLENNSEDRILALLPLSFDYGLSQITSAFFVGASCIIMDYFLPSDVARAIARYQITGLAAVPPLWQKLITVDWHDNAKKSLRYFCNSGGAMPLHTLGLLRDTFPNARPYLMYGLTEAFRSTYLEPAEIGRRPGSIGKAIPNAEVLVLREDGSECEPDEPGELVHRGPLVSLGYWNDPGRTAQRFRLLPGSREGAVLPEFAVWSGDTVVKDQQGFLFFVGRKDDMIKTSGYRVSPTEIEEVCYQNLPNIAEVVVTSVADTELGESIVILLVAKKGTTVTTGSVLPAIKRNLPSHMHPKHLEIRTTLPRNPNGKIDRSQLRQESRAKYSNV